MKALTMLLSESGQGWSVSMEDPCLPGLPPEKLGESPLSARLPHRSLEARPLALQQVLGKLSQELGLSQGYWRQAGPRAGPGPGSKW